MMIDQIKPLASILGAGLMMLGLIGPPAPATPQPEPAVQLASDWSDVTDVAVVDEIPAAEPPSVDTTELRRINQELVESAKRQEGYAKQLAEAADRMATASERNSGGFESSGGMGANWDDAIAKVAKQTAAECKCECDCDCPTIDEIRAVFVEEFNKPRKYESIMPTSMQYTSPAGNPKSSNGSAGGSPTFAGGSTGGALATSVGPFRRGPAIDTPARTAAVPSRAALPGCYTDANGNTVCPANRSSAASNDGWYLGKFLGR